MYGRYMEKKASSNRRSQMRLGETKLVTTEAALLARGL